MFISPSDTVIVFYMPILDKRDSRDIVPDPAATSTDSGALGLQILDKSSASSIIPGFSSSPTVPLNPTIQDLLNANPYRNPDFKESPWQAFLSGLGFKTEYDTYMEQMRLQAKEYDAGVLEKAYNENYDSASENASRMREAGLNPDLLGADQGGDSSSLRDDGNPPTPPVSDIESIQGFTNTVMSAFSGAVGFIKSFGDIRGLILNNDAKSLDNDQSYLRLAQDIILHSTHRSDFRKDGDWMRNARNDAMWYANRNFRYGSRKHDRFVKAVEAVFSGIPTEQKQFDAWLKDQQSFKAGTFQNTSSDFSDEYRLLRKIGTHLGRFAFRTNDLLSQITNVQAQNDLGRETYRDGEMEGIALANDAEARAYEGENRIERASIIKMINDTWSDMTKDISKDASNGDIGAAIFLALLNYGRLQLMR